LAASSPLTNFRAQRPQQIYIANGSLWPGESDPPILDRSFGDAGLIETADCG
jgi:hypothetical protein